MRPGKVVLAVVGVVVALVAVGFLAGGGGLLWAQATQRDADGFFTSPDIELSTAAYAITAPEIDLGSQPGDWLPSGRLASIKVQVVPQSGDPVFVGVGPADDVNAYLGDVAHSEVARIVNGDATYREIAGEAPTLMPSVLTFWAASGEDAFTWDLEAGEWTVVIMNADGAPGVEVDASAGARSDLVAAVGVGLLIFGVLLGALAAFMLVIAFRRDDEVGVASGQGLAVSAGFGSYPVLLEAQIDPTLSRWQWLVKWLLAVPHYIVLFFLWVAFGVLTVIAFFAILFTGRYPKGLFEFNVGVMRWTWRVGFYSYSALGTDQYPPFTLGDADYPASFDVEYPERLSHGLPLIKWLLALPHLLIVGLLTSGLVWWTTDLNGAGDAVLEVGGGLIGILVLVAGFALLFAGRYPEGLFDLIVGLNRWVYRVWAYIGLMRDEYPPFRLDSGGFESGAATNPPDDPSEGGGLPGESNHSGA